MEHLDRRSVIKNLAQLSAFAAAGPLLSAVSGCCGKQDRRLQLNVVLHGLFVLHFEETHIELLTPKVPDHIYKAGNWDFNDVFCINEGAQHVLRGVTSTPHPPQIISNCDVDFSQEEYKFKLRSDKSRHKIYLPFPDNLALLRCSPDPELPADYPPTCLYPYPGEKVTCVNKLSLCQVLVYRVDDYCNLVLTGTTWKPKIDRKYSTANLHFWAEPQDRLSPCHADHAYQKLDDLLDTLHLRLGFYSTVPLDKDTGILGLPPEQEQGWSDWASGGGEGAYPTNCCSVIVRK
ncbi:MAG TPA: hypothetical protein VIK39_06455 [Candidatus Angelobacter sp.]